MTNVDQIIKAAGGATAIARRFGVSEDGTPNMTDNAVHKWRRLGIPERHWRMIMKHANVTVDELYKANRKVRRAMAQNR